jgi:hypothetical protein
LGVRADKANEQPAFLIFSQYNKPVIVAFDVEYHSVVADKAGMSVIGFDVGYSLSADEA